MEEIEVDTVMVLSRKMKLRTINGKIIVGHTRVFESDNPYILVFLVNTEYGSIRMDIFKEDLARELRLWLEGKVIRNPVVLVPIRIEEAMNKFVNFGKTPLQEDLIMWMLSRTELYLGDKTQSALVFGGRDHMSDSNWYDDQGMTLNDQELTQSQRQVNVGALENEYNHNVIAAIGVRDDNADSERYRMDNAMYGSGRPGKGLGSINFGGNASKALAMSQTRKRYNENDLGTFRLTQKILGKSQVFEMLKNTNATKVKGREGAKAVMTTAAFSADQWRICNDIEHKRKEIEKNMEERRKLIETAKTRQNQTADKYRTIRSKIEDEKGNNKIVKMATEELLTLQKIEADVLDDINRQRIRAMKNSQTVAWTKAPPYFANHRGRSQRGPVLGKGPLPPNATTSLVDPRLESTIKRYYWDSAGRRHIKTADYEDGNASGLVGEAMEAIKKAASNVAAYKLDLKAVFKEFDTSGDGYLQPEEMAAAFLSMGVKMDVKSMQAIFKHFDPNDSGSVHFGEFVWAFFNRRKMVRQWKRNTEKMTEAQIKEKFHMADTNGNGRLSPKEFKRLLKDFGMNDLADQDIEVMIDRFDVDGDGDIDMNEFRDFVESEQRNLAGTAQGGGSGAQSMLYSLPPPKASSSYSTRNGSRRTEMDNTGMGSAVSGGGSRSDREAPMLAQSARRPLSAPPGRPGGNGLHRTYPAAPANAYPTKRPELHPQPQQPLRNQLDMAPDPLPPRYDSLGDRGHEDVTYNSSQKAMTSTAVSELVQEEYLAHRSKNEYIQKVRQQQPQSYSQSNNPTSRGDNNADPQLTYQANKGGSVPLGSINGNSRQPAVHLQPQFPQTDLPYRPSTASTNPNAAANAAAIAISAEAAGIAASKASEAARNIIDTHTSRNSENGDPYAPEKSSHLDDSHPSQQQRPMNHLEGNEEKRDTYYPSEKSSMQRPGEGRHPMHRYDAKEETNRSYNSYSDTQTRRRNTSEPRDDFHPHRDSDVHPNVHAESRSHRNDREEQYRDREERTRGVDNNSELNRPDGYHTRSSYDRHNPPPHSSASASSEYSMNRREEREHIPTNKSTYRNEDTRHHPQHQTDGRHQQHYREAVPEEYLDGSQSLKDYVDPLWVSRMLQAQAEVEARVGKRYYRTTMD